MIRLFLSSVLLCGLVYVWRQQRRPKPLSTLRHDEDRMSPAWIVENVYRSGQDGDL